MSLQIAVLCVLAPVCLAWFLYASHTLIWSIVVKRERHTKVWLPSFIVKSMAFLANGEYEGPYIIYNRQKTGWGDVFYEVLGTFAICCSIGFALFMVGMVALVALLAVACILGVLLTYWIPTTSILAVLGVYAFYIKISKKKYIPEPKEEVEEETL